MCKLVLSEEAKLKVNFPKLHELQELIEPKDILKGKNIKKYNLMSLQT